MFSHSYSTSPQHFHCSLKVPEKYEKCFWVSSSGKIAIHTSQRKKVDNVVMANIGEDRKNPGIRILLIPSANGLLGERIEVRETSCPQDGKLSLKANEPYVRQQHAAVERKGNSTTLLFSLKELEILHQERSGQVNSIVTEHLYFYKSRLANKQHTFTNQ